MSNKKFIKQMRDLAREINMNFVMSEVKALTEIEYPQTFNARMESTKYVENLLRKEGFEGVEVVNFPADGKTTYQDKRMPMSWDVTRAKLTVLSNVAGLERKVIADYNEHPFSIVWGSVSTQEGGVKTRIITESDVFMGEDARGALILLEAGTAPREVLSAILDLGALGFITETLVGGIEAPDEITWVNNAVDDSGHWHVQSEDRDFIGFSITPRDARLLRAAAHKSHVYALAESDAYRHESAKVSLVTATVPGESKREFWLIAHLYEPLATDNSSGVISAIAIARMIRKLISEGKIKNPQYTLRLVFSMELYGTSAAADYFGGYLGDRAIGALNIDGMPITKDDDKLMVLVAPYSAPFCGNYAAIMATKLYEEAFPGGMKFTRVNYSNYGDDCPLNDSTVMLPTVWIHHDRNGRNSYHHNSINRVDFIDIEKCRSFVALNAFFALKMIAPEKEDIKIISEFALKAANDRLVKIAEGLSEEPEATSRMNYHFESEKKHLRDFVKYMRADDAELLLQRIVCPAVAPDKKVVLTPWQKYAKGIVAKRLTQGLPHDLVNIPRKDRKALPGLALYAPFANVMANLDGECDLYTLIKQAFWEAGGKANDAVYKKYSTCISYLADGGYVEIKNENEITKEAIESSLRALGLKEGDTVMLHSSVSACGHVIGGAKTIIDAFLGVIGKEGTLMAPAFTRPYMYFEGAHQRQRNFRPFRPDNIDGISTGTLPKVMLREYGAKRSAHATHSWCAIGKNSEYCVSAHGLLDSPCGDNNPMEKALELGGKIVFFGCGVSSNTFIHYLEDRANSNFLENAVIKIVREDGKHVTEVMRNHLPGCRDFYNYLTPECKFYKRAIDKGLEIKRELLGAGDIYAMNIEDVYRIGTELFKEDPDVTLCDRPECNFCSRYRRKKA